MKLGMRSDSKGRTPFEQKWGMHVKELAKAECVGPEAIYMRVRNYGTPFQRHPKPSVEEIMYGRTVGELAKEKGCHPLTIKNRLKEHGTVHYESKMDHNLGRVYGDYHWAKGKRYTKPNGWLHPLHPQYKMWRFTIIKHILEGHTLAQSVELFLGEIHEVE